MSDLEDFEAEFGDRAVPELDLPIIVEREDEREAITTDLAVQLIGIKHEVRAVYLGPGGAVVVEVGKTLTFPDTAFLLTPVRLPDEDI